MSAHFLKYRSTVILVIRRATVVVPTHRKAFLRRFHEVFLHVASPPVQNESGDLVASLRLRPGSTKTKSEGGVGREFRAVGQRLVKGPLEYSDDGGSDGCYRM